MADDGTLELMGQAIDVACKKSVSELTDNNIRTKTANVVTYDKDTFIATIYFIDDNNKNEYAIYNKSGEILSKGDTVKVYYTTNVAKGWIGTRMGEPIVKVESPPYISAKVTNKQDLNYDKIDRNILSVDFKVDGVDSDVVFSANQLCDVSVDGELTTYYKVDGATQEYKPVEIMDKGKRVISYIYPMTLSLGNHNFSVFLLSSNGGKGNIKVGGLLGALSGQISDIKDVVPPNENLLIYLKGVEGGTVIELPRLYQGRSTTKTVDWGDGSDTEDSLDKEPVSHTYTDYGNYVITIKCDNTRFQFEDGSSITSHKKYISAIYLPDSASYIRISSYLSDCPILETVYLGKKADMISSLNCKNTRLSSLFFPDEVTYMAVELDNTKVSSLVIPKKVTSARDFTFLDSLTKIEFKNKVLSDCRGCENLKEVIMSNDIENVPDWCFLDCKTLNNVRFSSELRKIGANAFRRTELTILPLLPKLTTINTDAFEDCSSLNKIYLGNEVLEIGDRAFKNCPELMFAFCTSKKLTKIGSAAFQDSPINIDLLVFRDSLKQVGESAFSNTGIIEGWLFPGVTYGNKVFYSCKSMGKFLILPTVSIIPDGCCQNCYVLESVDIPSSVITIGATAFRNSGIKEPLVLKDGLQTINNGAFQECKRLESVKIESTLSKLGTHIFADCISLKSVVFNGGTEMISSYMFSGCVSLDKVSLGKVTQIDGAAFINCTALSSIEFNNDTIIGANAFRNTGLTKLEGFLDSLAKYPDGTTSYGGIYNIGQQAFAYCTLLKEVDGLEYKYNVGLKKVEKTRKSTSDSWSDPEETDMGLMARGIYDKMGATEDSVFSNTGLKSIYDYLKEHSEYADISTDTYICKYSVYHYVDG